LLGPWSEDGPAWTAGFDREEEFDPELRPDAAGDGDDGDEAFDRRALSLPPVSSVAAASSSSPSDVLFREEDGRDDDPDEDLDALFDAARAAEDARFAAAAAGAGAAAASAPLFPPLEVGPYALEDVLSETPVWDYTVAVLAYDPSSDKFLGLYNRDKKWRAGNKKLFHALRDLAYALRKLFPERFAGPRSSEFAVVVGSGDYPHVDKNRLPRTADGKAPVLMFGSAFRDPRVYPTMVAMPMPVPSHLECFMTWMEEEEVCPNWNEQLAFGEEGRRWEDLIPQVIWRGTDFSYLPTLQPRVRDEAGGHPALTYPDPRRYFADDGSTTKGQAVDALHEKYDALLPRWKGVALSARAELDARAAAGEAAAAGEPPPLPWLDVKFSSYLQKGKSSTLGSRKYASWESAGIGVAKGMAPADMAAYRYHVDLGGGGGTTWSGTVEKLAMPGLLFHHVTPTKDYVHDLLRPWVHYVPVRSDLRDLRRKFEWAESRPERAKAIADAGTALMRELGRPAGFGRMFEEAFAGPLRKVVEAYRPLPPGSSWREVLGSMEACRDMPVIECDGNSRESSCGLVGGEAVLNWQRTGRYVELQTN
ncbi:hypothetical protein ACHAWF_014704, partial [Thalassiosira exigua]